MVTFFKALSDESRLRLINILYYYEFNVNELLNIMDMGQSRVSRHLKILCDSSLLTFNSIGANNFYKLNKESKFYNLIVSMLPLLKKESQMKEDLLKADREIALRQEKKLKFFNSLAKNWSSLRRELFESEKINEILESTIISGNSIVDLGCGTGEMFPFLKRKFSSVLGVDSSDKMLAKAENKIKLKGISLRLGRLEFLPLKNREVDAALMHFTLRHIDRPLDSLLEANRILKKEGLIYILDFLPHKFKDFSQKYGDKHLGFSEEEIDVLLKKSGFIVKSREKINIRKELDVFLVVGVKE